MSNAFQIVEKNVSYNGIYIRHIKKQTKKNDCVKPRFLTG